MITPLPATAPSPTLTQPTALVPAGSASQSSAGVSFGDVLDAVNPLQHIPVVSSLYRAVTGSQISAGSQIAGDTIYGALLPGGAVAGLASSLANVAVKAISGKDIAGNLVSAVAPAPSTPAAATPLIADKQASPATTTAAQTPITAIPLSSTAGHSANSQYQRTQALDVLNRRLVKMAV